MNIKSENFHYLRLLVGIVRHFVHRNMYVLIYTHTHSIYLPFINLNYEFQFFGDSLFYLIPRDFNIHEALSYRAESVY